MKINRFVLLSLLTLQGFGLSVYAQQKDTERTDNPWQVDVAAGMQSFYAPAMGAKSGRPELITTAGVGKPLGPQQTFAVTLQLGYARNNYHGDALFLQLLGQYTPVIAKKVEAGIGLGIGYRVSMYSSEPLKWERGNWKKGNAIKGMFQVPVQLSLGYRSLQINHYELRPYVAYQMQALLGYNPDLPLLPVSASLLGIKIQKH